MLATMLLMGLVPIDRKDKERKKRKKRMKMVIQKITRVAVVVLSATMLIQAVPI